VVLSTGAGYPSLSALPRAALRLLFGDPPWGAGGAGRAILALAALGNAGLGVYHAGVEWKFWQGPTDCTGEIGNLGSAGNLLERLDTVKVIRCDEVQWRFLGLSLAGYNVLISLAMAALAGWGIVRTARR
jgi:disulfide bond formation protein DsbB